MYQALIVADRSEDVRIRRDNAEYLAAFSEPETVLKVIRKREEAQTDSDNDQEFTAQVEQLFGKKMISSSADKDK